MQRQFRLRQSADFEQVRARGRQWHHPYLTLVAAPNELTYNRYGFVTSRRLGGAVVRNRVRRVMRESVRLMDLRPGFDMVFLARNAIVGQPYKNVNAAIHELVQQARLLGG
jgi:ribonuclease P protein component